MPDKFRIKKYQLSRVEHLAQRLGIPQSKVVEDSINFYFNHIVYIDAHDISPINVNVAPPALTQNLPQANPNEMKAMPALKEEVDEEKEVYEGTGGIELEF